MADKLNRQQLAQFLPTPGAIRAFEDLFNYVAETSPDNFDELTSILLSVARRSSNSAAIQRLDELEQIINRPVNLTDVLNRLDALEQLVEKRVNLTDILNRLSNIESILGV